MQTEYYDILTNVYLEAINRNQCFMHHIYVVRQTEHTKLRIIKQTQHCWRVALIVIVQ